MYRCIQAYQQEGVGRKSDDRYCSEDEGKRFEMIVWRSGMRQEADAGMVDTVEGIPGEMEMGGIGREDRGGYEAAKFQSASTISR